MVRKGQKDMTHLKIKRGYCSALIVVILLAGVGVSGCGSPAKKATPDPLAGEGPLTVTQSTEPAKLPFFDLYGYARAQSSVYAAVSTSTEHITNQIVSFKPTDTDLKSAQIVYTSQFAEAYISSVTELDTGQLAFIDSGTIDEDTTGSLLMVGDPATKEFEPVASDEINVEDVARFAAVGSKLFYVESSGDEDELLDYDDTEHPYNSVQAGQLVSYDTSTEAVAVVKDLGKTDSQVFAVSGRLYWISYQGSSEATSLINTINRYDPSTGAFEGITTFTGGIGELIGAGEGRLIVLESSDELSMYSFDISTGTLNEFNPGAAYDWGWSDVEISGDLMTFVAGVGEPDEEGTYESYNFTVYDFVSDTAAVIPFAVNGQPLSPSTAFFKDAHTLVAYELEYAEVEIEPEEDPFTGEIITSSQELIAAYSAEFALSREPVQQPTDPTSFLPE
jgi:hypothetical protein